MTKSDIKKLITDIREKLDTVESNLEVCSEEELEYLVMAFGILGAALMQFIDGEVPELKALEKIREEWK